MRCEVIPVIDLLAGQVVHARRGERHRYRPIASSLCPSSAPEAVLDALVAAFAPRVVYIADLDALQGGTPQLATLARMAAAHPERELWIDIGVRTAADLEALVPLGDVVPVIASESLQDAGVLAARGAAVLSLDFRGDALVDAAGVWERVPRWPSTVIAMTLARVGSDAGPDLACLAAVRAHLQRHAHPAALYAAGGVRDARDLDVLAQAGIAGVLVASALHEGRLRAEEVAARR